MNAAQPREIHPRSRQRSRSTKTEDGRPSAASLSLAKTTSNATGETVSAPATIGSRQSARYSVGQRSATPNMRRRSNKGSLSRPNAASGTWSLSSPKMKSTRYWPLATVPPGPVGGTTQWFCSPCKPDCGYRS